MHTRLIYMIAITPLVACTPSSNDVVVRLAPDVVSSLDGTLAVRAIVLADRQPSPSEHVDLAVSYTDRNGTAHTIAPASGTTDKTGAFDATLTGLTWDGTGMVTATVTGTTVVGTATFAVLDRTPPKVTITPPANNTVRRGAGVTIQVHATDEIGISQVFFDSSDAQNRDRSTIASGAADVTVGFDFQTDAAVGSQIMLYALAADLSGNEGAAPSIMITVAP